MKVAFDDEYRYHDALLVTALSHSLQEIYRYGLPSFCCENVVLIFHSEVHTSHEYK